MIKVVQAYDRAPFAEVQSDDADALEIKLEAARRAFLDRDGWLVPHERIAVLRRLAKLLGGKVNHFARLIAREGGKPLADATVEAMRAVDSVQSAADEMRTFAGQEIPMGLTAASTGRMAFTIKEPIGVVAAISAFNHPFEVDGGQNCESAGQAIEAGASAIVAGSAIFGSPDYAAAIAAIRAGRLSLP